MVDFMLTTGNQQKKPQLEIGKVLMLTKTFQFSLISMSKKPFSEKKMKCTSIFGKSEEKKYSTMLKTEECQT